MSGLHGPCETVAYRGEFDAVSGNFRGKCQQCSAGTALGGGSWIMREPRPGPPRQSTSARDVAASGRNQCPVRVGILTVLSRYRGAHPPATRFKAGLCDMTAHESDEDLGELPGKGKMATDYDAPRKTEEELNEDSIEELKTRATIRTRGRSTRTRPMPRKPLSFPAQTSPTRS